MPFRVSNLRLPVEEPDDALPTHLARALGVPVLDIASWRVLRKALDLRDKADLRFVYNCEVELADKDETILRNLNSAPSPIAKVETFSEPPFAMPDPGSVPLPHRPVVVGSGPGGPACASFWAKPGYPPLVLERGTRVSARIRAVETFDKGGEFHPESNFLFGERGA